MRDFEIKILYHSFLKEQGEAWSNLNLIHSLQRVFKEIDMEIKKLHHKEKIKGPRGLTLGDFWSWAYSDILSNRNRSVFAEFLVGSALNVTENARIEWTDADLNYKGKKIEVKSSAYLQSWHQKELSKISFGIAKKRSWDPKTNEISDEAVRASDCYVFCLYPETNPDKVNILDVGAWEFYVLSTELINQELGDQKSVGIKRIRGMCRPVSYDNLKAQIDKVL